MEKKWKLVFGFRFGGVGVYVSGLRFEVQGLGCSVWGLWSRFRALRFRVLGA